LPLWFFGVFLFIFMFKTFSGNTFLLILKTCSYHIIQLLTKLTMHFSLFSQIFFISYPLPPGSLWSTDTSLLLGNLKSHIPTWLKVTLKVYQIRDKLADNHFIFWS
jgi:hypothetical protein